MSTNSQNNTDSQEIDLLQISRSISNSLASFKYFLYSGIRFVINNIILLGILFVIGVGLGFYMDKTQKTYDHEIIVTPNFGSTDYLYSKIQLLKSKVKEKDEDFLKAIGIKNPNSLKRIEINPVTDVYRFVNNSDKNFELLKLMAEDGDIKKILEENTTSKNYIFHKVSFTTSESTNDDSTIKPILEFLNDTDFYRKLQKEYMNNIKEKMVSNDSIISQIDGVLNEFSNTVNSSSKNDKLVYYNENTQLNDVIKTKDEMVQEQGDLRVSLVSLDKIIKDNSSTINIENTESINGKMKLVLPFLFIFIYLFIRSIVTFYKKQKALNPN
ncbi:MAG: hypothetical protein J0L86_03965 [Flavobacteriales bacterium]|nr:hypothetical protein [Flavobacteriales bacterium]